VFRHRVSLAGAFRRVIHVEVDIDLPPGVVEQDIHFPVWTPGSYLIREHERHLHDWRATIDGRAAASTKVSKNVYRVRTDGATKLQLSYEIYAHELTVRTSHVDPSHAFLNPITFCPYVPGREKEQQELVVTDLPQGWDAACALPERRQNNEVTFLAADFDELVDSPVECGPHARPSERLQFEVRGVPHDIVMWGRSPLDRERFKTDVAKIVEAQAAMFGGLPYQRYLFIVHASDTGRGGLEHRASAALLYPRNSVLKPKGYEDFLGLVSHELFHAWNVKRIKPEAFTPYDLSRENYTRQLWAFEGLTSYFEDIVLVRAGLMSRKRYLEVLAERMTTLEKAPGRKRHPVGEASFDAWIRYYRQDENSENSSVSYYLKGSLIGNLVDLEIRRRTNGAKSLDDAMRLLWERHGAIGRGVPEDGVERACSEVAGADLSPLFDLAIRSTSDLPLEDALVSHGIKTSRRVAVSGDDKGGAASPGSTAFRCEVGLTIRAEGDRQRVAAVKRDSAAEAAGFCPGDELVAIDGLRADGSAAARLLERQPGVAIEVLVFRRDELQRLSLTPREPVADTFVIEEDPSASEGQKTLLAKWLPTSNSK
jgi:predicted metalloprotease with PDZ domain